MTRWRCAPTLVSRRPATPALPASSCEGRPPSIRLDDWRPAGGRDPAHQPSTHPPSPVVPSLLVAGPVLASVFADPGVVKVLHGSDSDVVWLQRDFGLFLCNMFDTGQASNVAVLTRGLASLGETVHVCARCRGLKQWGKGTRRAGVGVHPPHAEKPNPPCRRHHRRPLSARLAGCARA